MKRFIVAASMTLLVAVVACEPDTQPSVASNSPASSALTIDGDHLIVAAEDQDQVLVVDRATHQVLHRVDVSDGPTHVIMDEGRAIVTARYANALDVVDVDSGEVLSTIEVGVEPYGMTKLQDGRVAVTLAGEAAVALVDIDSASVEKIALEAKDPRGIAQVADGRLFITHLTAGKMSAVSLSGVVQTLAFTTPNEFGPQTNAHMARSITLNEDGTEVIVAHSQANTSVVRAPIEGGGDEVGGSCGYGGCAAELPAVTPAVTTVDTTTDMVVVPTPASPSQNQNAIGDCFDCDFGGVFVPNPPSFLNPNEERFQGIHINNPQAIALFDDGAGQLVLNLGTQNVLMLRRTLDGTPSDVIGQVEVGNGASSIIVAPEGDRAYVWNQFDASITEFELPVVASALRTQSKFVPQNGQPVTAEFHEATTYVGETYTIAEDVLPPEQSLGRKLFHSALDRRISQSRNISCATCHPDGRTDGQTWQFTFGPRNTPQLGGGILDTAPFHWPGDARDIRDINSVTVLAFMGGTGVDNSSMDAIGAYIDTIRAAPAPNALAVELTDAQARGKAIFESDETECLTCHSGAHHTDNRSWDVQTQANSNDISLFQTPVLHGLARSAPYLHSGAAATLSELLAIEVATDRMGKGSHLSSADLADLAAYLETL